MKIDEVYTVLLNEYGLSGKQQAIKELPEQVKKLAKIVDTRDVISQHTQFITLIANISFSIKESTITSLAWNKKMLTQLGIDLDLIMVSAHEQLHDALTYAPDYARHDALMKFSKTLIKYHHGIFSAEKPGPLIIEISKLAGIDLKESMELARTRHDNLTQAQKIYLKARLANDSGIESSREGSPSNVMGTHPLLDPLERVLLALYNKSKNDIVSDATEKLKAELTAYGDQKGSIPTVDSDYLYAYTSFLVQTLHAHLNHLDHLTLSIEHPSEKQFKRISDVDTTEMLSDALCDTHIQMCFPRIFSPAASEAPQPKSTPRAGSGAG
ncbi:MAG: hypothetical protein COB66_02995 [Coxiella sp. (in: Bacteria)]|nr:MAG: hypothetical protein COB66_02995 [Coxiella sp. (in: g-proteobacteria)]